MPTVSMGEKAYELYRELANDANISTRFMLTRILLREARATSAILPSEKLARRLELIDSVEDELSEKMFRPPQKTVKTSERAKNRYQKIWTAHRRLARRGLTPKEIHNYCMKNYGEDIDIGGKTRKKKNKRL